MRVGDIEVIAVPDGEAKLPPEYFPNADWGPHRDLLGPDGMFDISIGCFLVRTGDQVILIDAGIGPVDSPIFRGGELPGRLESAGVRPDDVNTVVCTHLHMDHIGWLVRDGAPYFPNATVRFGREELDQFVRDAEPADYTRQIVEVLRDAGRIETIDGDGEIAPGISSLHTPGHTLGHQCLVLSSGDRRAFLLGDAVTCPVQVTESEWEAMSDVDPAAAKRSREALWRELEGTEDLAVAMHFPGLEFGRVVAGEGKRYFT